MRLLSLLVLTTLLSSFGCSSEPRKAIAEAVDDGDSPAAVASPSSSGSATPWAPRSRRVFESDGAWCLAEAGNRTAADGSGELRSVKQASDTYEAQWTDAGNTLSEEEWYRARNAYPPRDDLQRKRVVRWISDHEFSCGEITAFGWKYGEWRYADTRAKQYAAKWFVNDREIAESEWFGLRERP